MIDPGWLSHAWYWFEVHTGTVNESGPYYGFWSGFGSDIGEITLIAAVASMYKKHNCHTKGCWRIGKHPVAGTPYVVCAKCHPEIPDGGASKEHIHQKHREHLDNVGQ